MLLAELSKKYDLTKKEGLKSMLRDYCGPQGVLAATSVYKVLPAKTTVKIRLEQDYIEVLFSFAEVEKVQQELNQRWSTLNALIRQGIIQVFMTDKDCLISLALRVRTAKKLALTLTAS